MKTVLVVLIVAALGGYTYHLQTQLTEARAVQAAAPAPAPAEPLDPDPDLLAKIANLEEQLAKAQADLAEARKPVAPAPQAPRTAPAAPAPAAPAGSGSPAPDSEARLADLARAHRAAVAPHETQLATLDRNETTWQAHLAQLQQNAPAFQEQRDRVDAAGRIIGKAGVRTSQADREKALAVHNAEVAKAQAQLQAIAAKRAEIQAQLEQLTRQYQAARAQVP